MSALRVLLLFSAVMKLMKAPIVVKGFAYKMPLTNSVIYGAVPPSQESRNFYGRPIATK